MKRTFSDFNNKAYSKISTAKLEVIVNPVEAIFEDAVLRPGSTVQGRKAITVFNPSEISLRYWIFADWSPVPPTTSLEALMAAQITQVLIIKPVLPPLTIFSGSLQQLNDIPQHGRLLESMESEELNFTLLLSSSILITLDARLKVDFLFVAESL
ncbi:MAG: hypothetical protein Q7J85_03390 [Bacillota bacterium]|nr:hypothetical protein [Bacillota bacterium]